LSLDSATLKLTAAMNLELTKDDVQHNRLSYLACTQAHSKGELSMDKPMICFHEEDFSVIRAFCKQFQTMDYCEENYQQSTEDNKLYNTLWEMPVQAKSPREAAIKALEIMKDPEEAIAFFVSPADDFSKTPVFVDLNVDMEMDDSEEDRQAL